MLLIIGGKSGSGKDSVVKEFEKNGWKKIIKYTNRPKREGEIDGVDYHFVSTELMETIPFIFKQSFVVANGDTWYYGFPMEHIILPDNKNDKYITIMTPFEYNSFLNMTKEFKIIGKDFISVQIDIPDDIRRERLIKRGDNIEEINRRIKADNKDFEGWELKHRKESQFPLFYIRDGIGDRTPEDIYNTIIKMMES